METRIKFNKGYSKIKDENFGNPVGGWGVKTNGKG